MSPSHSRIYHEARCYDVAFGFRDVAAECDMLASLAARHIGRPAVAVLELAAGPARHAREFARRGAEVATLDSAPSMRNYAVECAVREGVRLQAACGDMCNFRLEGRFDLALLLMDSASYMLDNDAFLRHLACVAEHVTGSSLYVLQMSHPRDVFGVGASTNTRWTSEADGLRVEMRWGADGDSFDPVTQVDDVTVTMNWSGSGDSGQLVERARQRRFTANEVDALVRASGHFDIIDWLGSLAPHAAFSKEPDARFMIPVLQKRRLAS